jgi:hypothetical protein
MFIRRIPLERHVPKTVAKEFIYRADEPCGEDGDDDEKWGMG